MRVLLVIPAVGPIYGGPSKIALSLAEALGRRGVQVDLVTTNANGRDDLDVPVNVWHERANHRERYFTRWRLSGEFKVSLPLLRWLGRHVKEYDFVHAFSIFNFAMLANAWACRWRDVPYVVNPQGMLEPWALSYKAGKKRIYYRLLERPALQGAAALQALNQGEADNITALQLGPPTAIIPNGVDPSDDASGACREPLFKRFPELRGKTLVLFMHRIDPKKGLDSLATAFAVVHQRHPNAHLVIAGPDNIGFGPIAVDGFTQAGCAEAVTFTGLLAGEEKRAALAAASVFVAPSYSEGFSMSVLEAMISGLPCVITTGCNFPEAGAAGAARIVPPEAASFAVALGEVLARPEEASAMGEHARKLIFKRYTWDQVARQAEELYLTCREVAYNGKPMKTHTAKQRFERP